MGSWSRIPSFGDLGSVLGFRSPWFQLLLCATLLLGAALRFYDLGGKSLWGDEVLTAIAVERYDLTGLLYNTIPPLRPWLDPYTDAGIDSRIGSHFPALLLAKAFEFTGADDFGLRLSAAFTGILGLAAIYALGAALFGPWTGLTAALLLAVSPFHLYHSQEARYYALMVLLSLLSFYFLYKGLEDARWRWWIGLALVIVLNIYNHYFALLTIPALAAYALAVIGWNLWDMARRHAHVIEVGRASQAASDAPKREVGWLAYLARPLVAILLAALLVGPLLVPFLISAFGGAGKIALSLANDASIDGGEAVEAFTLSAESLARLLGRYGMGWGTNLALYLGLFAIGIAGGLLQRRWRPMLLLFLWLLVPFIPLIVVQSNRILYDRYMIFLLPAYITGVAAGLVMLAAGVSGWVGQRTIQQIGWAAGAILVVAVTLLAWRPVSGYYNTPKGNDFRTACQLLREFAEPNDFVLVVRQGRSELGYEHYCSDLPQEYAARFLDLKTLAANFDARNHSLAARIWVYNASNAVDTTALEWMRQNLTSIPLKGMTLRVGTLGGYRLPPHDELDLLQRASELTLGYAPLYRALAQAASSRQDAASAQAALNAALTLEHASPSNVNPSLTEATPVASTRSVTDVVAAYLAQATSHMNQMQQAKDRARTVVYGKASEDLARAQMLLPEDAAVHIALGRFALLGEKPADAIAAYRTALSYDPKSIPALLGLAQALSVDGQLDAAITAYKQAMELAPLPVDSLMRLAALYRKTEAYAPALAVLEEVVASKPNMKQAWQDLGGIYQATQQPDKAIAAYTRALELGDQDAHTHEALAKLYEAQNACANAIEHRARLLELRPGAWTHIFLGQDYLACRQPELALAQFQAAIAMKPDIPDTHYGLGLAYEALAKPREAQAAFTQTLEIATSPFWRDRAQKKLEQIATSAGASENTP